ncbi:MULTISPECIES: winged helix-turn-helix transcriptional regulator [Myxococcus]|uniref:HxlR family transcriptional regulator n=1 Tax=Myxococcus xanthus TaxID=34 RepID=A0AAE6G3T6_MYXXA|nr:MULTISPECIES: helix-turn-helix domain-containing protein [Myxococcus]QDE70185.1 HxlR family transcriptional regulator [Myxococcus xanthus]QDE77465.1 HxlR family transcriptional regulator [Myxococcus xanthus]WAM24291.1 helix-turn-helix domain-containing protein [Myxococcus sp. NMCA1]
MAKKQRAADCGLGTALTVIGGKWKPTLEWALHLGPTRFGELNRQVLGISEKVLFEQLRELEAAGVVGRAVFDSVPPKVEYSLTQTGAELSNAVHTLSEWGRNHAPRDGGAPSRPPSAIQVNHGTDR